MSAPLGFAEDQPFSVTTRENPQLGSPINNNGNFERFDHRRNSSATEVDNDRENEKAEVESSGSSERIGTVASLARTFTHGSIKGADGEHVNPFTSDENPMLNPLSNAFNPKAWVKTLIGISSRDPERYPKRVAGISYKNLNVHGFGTPTEYQKSFGNAPLELLNIPNMITGKGKTKIQILRNFEGLVKSGEMLVVLGRPGSGCSTLLKSIAGETDGFYVDDASEVNYQGIPMQTMHKDFRGECIYQAEVDVHFPQLTVGQTLEFAALARAPANRFPGVSREKYAQHMRDVVMAIFGLSHTMNTKVGNDFIRGVSGGERKRVSIAEACLGGSPLQCWDNSTRGLDSATALEFVKTLKLSTELGGSAAVVAIYQASQSIYDMFDKVVVLYEGRQIYFGNIHKAKHFFLNLGFECPPRQTTADFLTSLTSAAERNVRKGYESKVPRTPDEFAAAWQKSEDRAELLREIAAFEQEHPIGGSALAEFRKGRKAQAAKGQRPKSPYTLSLPMQVKLCMKRGFQRLKQDMSSMLVGILGNSIMALVIGSVFYNLDNNTGVLFSRGSLLFFGILMNAFASAMEILTLYAQRPIVEKHKTYAFYHPVSEAIASMVCDIPNKLTTSIFFSLTLYFMTNLRREPGAFFIFYLFGFSCTLAMSMIFRTMASVSRTLSQALVPAALLILALVIYTGFAIPISYMKPWFRWINYLNPVGYAFESMMINEFRNRRIPCTVFVPSGTVSPEYENVSGNERVCSAVGALPGADYLDGSTYLSVAYGYEESHLWRNLGLIIAITIFGLVCYLTAAELVSPQKSKGEVLLFPRGKVPTHKQNNDEEGLPDSRTTAETTGDSKATRAMTNASRAGDAPVSIQRQTAIFHWSSVVYDIKIKNEPRRLLDHVDGWVKPGTLTALMGVSGAGKTTLLDVLASRVTMGVVTGQMLVNGRQRDSGFQRKTGYVQQQDLHLATSTVREALTFSALLRQPSSVPRQEKIDYVDEVLAVLEMESYADAVVGVPGEGLNVEQRKRLTIGVEMAAKPQLLMFLDEPTSGLDSQTAWSICSLLRKLADNGQAILCTIHQPSAILFQSFDRLLFLAKGGRTVYFGAIGENSKVLTNYFENKGSRSCGPDENPAEWMLDVIGASPGSSNSIDWPQTWLDSQERRDVKEHLAELKATLSALPTDSDSESLRSYAASYPTQFQAVVGRVFEQYWRTPVYLYSKLTLCLLSALFIGFSFFKTSNSLQGMQNQLFSIFMLLTIFGNISQQIMPHFATQRSLYEVRERPSKTYSWQVFILAQIIVEIPWNSLAAVLIFVSWYYPIGLYKNAENALGGSELNERGILMFLFIWAFLMFTSTFTDMIIAGIESVEAASNIGNMMFSFSLIFCGVLASPDVFPRFWIFMYRVSPFTYIVDGLLSVGIANTVVECADVEYLHFDPPSGQTCSQYLANYIDGVGGYLTAATENATSDCSFCTVDDTNTFLSSFGANYTHRWRNFGFIFVYLIFNIFAAVGLYWLARVPKGKREENETQEEIAEEQTRRASMASHPGKSKTVQS